MTIIGVIGLGFVGDAIFHSLSTKDTNEIQIIGYDKYKYGGIGKIEQMLKCNIIFICLPTPYNDLLKTYELHPFDEVLEFLQEHQFHGLILIKSTINPGTSQKLADQYQLKIVHNPEFLTARTARVDFEQQSHIVLGLTNNITDQQQIKNLSNLYQKLYPQAHISIVKSIESETMKMLANNFYAVKVQIFNEFYLLCQKLNADYDVVKNLMLRNGWISPHHIDVPGPDGNLSYGGLCFPKDTKSLLALMEKLDTPCKVLKATVEERDSMRDDN